MRKEKMLINVFGDYEKSETWQQLVSVPGVENKFTSTERPEKLQENENTPRRAESSTTTVSFFI